MSDKALISLDTILSRDSILSASESSVIYHKTKNHGYFEDPVLYGEQSRDIDDKNLYNQSCKRLAELYANFHAYVYAFEEPLYTHVPNYLLKFTLLNSIEIKAAVWANGMIEEISKDDDIQYILTVEYETCRFFRYPFGYRLESNNGK